MAAGSESEADAAGAASSGGGELQGNLWVYMGNLDWMMPQDELERHIRALLATLPAVAEGKADLGGSVEDVEIAGYGYKRKPRDEGKLHGGFALLRFEDAEAALKAADAIHGKEMASGARGAVRASLARARVDKGEEEKAKQKQRTEKREAKLVIQRAHNHRQRQAN
eukprot:CAMPEP_0173461840 /NCGR_PEP_ID=MMETSP1357-20121228/65610_1 /TAXON_ID=77926 /ORGANISM="Hemiselmis rufescens, Strain PCC563" /LENGTH=166 /DNA_ID=CAMNT_0014429531 /DNA_START=59 /DNA_END=556 /DNA_ORIENTATION=+